MLAFDSSSFISEVGVSRTPWEREEAAIAIGRMLAARRGPTWRGRLEAELTSLISPICDDADEAAQHSKGALERLELIRELTLVESRLECTAPAFVMFDEAALVLGGRSDGRPLLPRDLVKQLEQRGAGRWLRGEGIERRLEEAGLERWTPETWLAAPADLWRSTADLLSALEPWERLEQLRPD